MVDLGVATGFVIVFAVIGGLEVFDRTSFALIAIASRSRPLPTFAGGALSFVATTVVAVTVGAGLVDLLGPAHILWVRVGGGAVLLAYAAWLYLRGPEPERAATERAGSVFVVAFGTIFLLELADTTMIFEIVFVATWGWLVVLVAGAAALVTVAAWDVALGRRLGMKVDPETLRKVVVVVLTVVGVVTIAYGLAPGAFPALWVAGSG
jgi:Ca2+/H+ antiporter, TMEM165/GDT1 family